MSVTAEQVAVVQAPLSGPRLVDAGAGTGKTFTLVERACWLVKEKKLCDDQLLVVTFTKAAAEEIAGRLDRALPANAGRPTCGTFHGIAVALLREFAYTTGISPDVRAVDDGRARGLFAQAVAELRSGKLVADTSAFPFLERTAALEKNLAALALRLRQRGIDAERFERDALAQADLLEHLPFGAITDLKKARGGVLVPKAGWPKPNPERTPEERVAEADRERRNVHVIAALLRRFDQLLAAESLLTFGDVLHRATAMLETYPEIRNELRARWLHAFVDEFQDTNPAQVAFLRALFGPELRQVLAVGDVRQAIYEFNGADPTGIVAFRDLPGCERHPLTENRRSVQPILDVAHAALATLGGVAPELHNQLRAHRGDAPATQVRVELFEGEDAVAQEADAIARRIRAYVDAGGSARGCAILVRTRRRAGVYAEALGAQGLAAQQHGGVGFFDAPEVREVIAWLRLVEEPDDHAALVVALQSAAIGLTDGAVALLAEGGALPQAALVMPPPVEFDPTERARLDRLRQTLTAVSPLADVPLVDAVRTVILASGAEIARADDPGVVEQVRANLDKLVRLAADLCADRPLARIRDLLAEFDAREALELDEPEAELGGERVSIMTIHGAKGLEWDHVFVANCSASSFPLEGGDARERVAEVDEETGALALKQGVDGRPTLRWYLTTQRHDAAGHFVPTEPDYSEEFRLFYVALTRAREAVYVSGRKTKKDRVSRCLDAVRIWLNQSIGADLRDHALRAEPAAAVPAASPVVSAADDAESLRRRIIARISRLDSARAAMPARPGGLSYSAIELHERCPRRARYHYVLGLPDLGEESPVRHTDGAARDRVEPVRVGRIVHGVLEQVAKGRIAGADIGEAFLEEALTEALAEEGGEHDEALRAEAARFVAHALPPLRDLQPLAAEQRFDLKIDGVPLYGFIDLLAEDQGRLVVVDYKTGRTPTDHYAMQFAIYARAVAEERGQVALTRVLRIGGDGATFEDVTPATDTALTSAVAVAAAMESDEARPGPQCGLCPYARDICREAAAFP